MVSRDPDLDGSDVIFTWRGRTRGKPAKDRPNEVSRSALREARQRQVCKILVLRYRLHLSCPHKFNSGFEAPEEAVCRNTVLPKRSFLEEFHAATAAI